jgi:pimeloyl-ACP methyl ester carboxylesterase
VSFTLERDGARLEGEEAGEGPVVVGLHGLTATRRYVLMGSRTLERSGRRVVLYDARGHGASAPAPLGDYSYAAQAADLAAVIASLDSGPAVVAIGASMGAHTALALALEQPALLAGLVIVTPAHDPEHPRADLEHWDALARGLREGGVEGFVAAYGIERLPAAWRGTVETVLRQRIAAHEHPLAVADALAAVPRSRPFESWSALRSLALPTIVVASRDEADPAHPLALARRYAHEIPGARLVIEEEGRSPIAWQGGQLSRLLLDFP